MGIEPVSVNGQALVVPQLVSIPGGEFVMGKDGSRYVDSSPEYCRSACERSLRRLDSLAEALGDAGAPLVAGGRVLDPHPSPGGRGDPARGLDG